jgi:putative membrane protein
MRCMGPDVAKNRHGGRQKFPIENRAKIVEPTEESPADPRVPLAKHRTSMASFRTQLALDRTMLAWIRTTLTFATFGFGMVGFFRSLEEKHPNVETVHLHRGAIQMGVALIVLGIVSMICAGASQWSTLRRLRRHESPVLRHWPLSLTVATLMTIIAIIGLGALFL